MTATVAGIHLGIDTHANRPAANTVPDGSLYSCSTHSLVYKSNLAGNSWATWATLSGGTVSLTTGDTLLGADVTLTTAGTFYDGPSVSLAAGTWSIFWKVLVQSSGSPVTFRYKLWDGATIYDEAEDYVNQSGFRREVSGFAPAVVLGSTTSIKISVAADTNSQTMKRDGGVGVNHQSTRISAIKVA